MEDEGGHPVDDLGALIDESQYKCEAIMDSMAQEIRDLLRENQQLKDTIEKLMKYNRKKNEA